MSSAARRTFIASFLGWTLDAFDFLLLTFVITRIATTFDRTVAEVTFAITLTLMCRPIGALIFGWLADRYGRRTPLMIDIAFFSVIELLTAFSPNFTVFLVLRALYGIAMGGEWGLGAALTMEVLPPNRRGFFSGMLQERLHDGLPARRGASTTSSSRSRIGIGARLFVIGVAAGAADLLHSHRACPSRPPGWRAARRALAFRRRSCLSAFVAHWPLFIYAIAFMAALNAMSHGTQDLYATFLQKQHGFSTGHHVAALDRRGGRGDRRRHPVRACSRNASAAAPSSCSAAFWRAARSRSGCSARASRLLALGAFVIQFCVQGAWGVIPAHLNELSPAELRGTFPGFTYQLGNLLVAGIAQIEATIAQKMPLPSGVLNYGGAMAIVTAFVLVAVVGLAALGYLMRKENRTASFTAAAPSNV